MSFSYTHLLIFAHADTAMNGNRLPVSITHYYNSCDSDKDEFGMDYGWRTSVMEGKAVMQQNNNSPRRKKMSFTMKDAYSVMLREYPDVMNIEHELDLFR